MSSMAISPSTNAEPAGLGRQHSFRNRQCSVYASHIKAAPVQQPGCAESTAEESRQLASIQPLPRAPQWDLMSDTALIVRSPTSPRRPPLEPWLESDARQLPASPTAAFFDSVSPMHSPVPRFPEPRVDSYSRPFMSKMSADMRLHDANPVENFSRPRKPSIRQPALTVAGVSESPVQRLAKLRTAIPPIDYNYSPMSPSSAWSQPRRPSTSSCKSSPTPSSPAFAIGEADARLFRYRNATGPTMASSRSPYSAFRPDGTSLVSMANGTTPWVSGDELRSSFRSQLTASTAPGTAVTERSSVLTNDSSLTSLSPNPDEPSLEDVMGMYEKGFADDDEEENDTGTMQSNTVDDKAYPDPNPAPKVMTETAREHGNSDWLDADASSAALNPPTSLDTEIRQSKLIFTSPAFIASVPAMADSLESPIVEKRDSGKSLDLELSVDSEQNATGDFLKSAALTPPVFPFTSPCPSQSSSPTPPLSLDDEEPDSRDRYGFKKHSHSITREEYDTWDRGYSQYLARRRKKWVAYLKDCALMTDHPIRFPAPTAKTKRFVRKGIPPDWRGAAWFYYAGGPAILAKHSGLYEKLVRQKAKPVDVDAIERDLYRTFPDNIRFKPSESLSAELHGERSASQSTVTRSPMKAGNSLHGSQGLEGEPTIIASLRRVLQAFSVYNPRIGYCQSLNFLAGLLLLFVETEEQCFWLLNVITIIYLPGTHDMSLEGSKVDLDVLMTELRNSMPAVWDRIGGELENETESRPGTSRSIRRPRQPMTRKRDVSSLRTDRLPPITLCMTAWFMSCYIGTLPIETTLRVWDVFFYEGSKTLFRVALAILKTGESEIKAVSDPMEMFGVVQSLPRRMLDANALMEVCFKRRNGFGHLSQDTIDERRQERRERTQQSGDDSTMVKKGGYVAETEAEPLGGGSVRRRGTLFGRRRKDMSRSRARAAQA